MAWTGCSAITWCAAVCLLASPAAAARLDLWPTGTGARRPGGNESRTFAEGEERIGWDLPSFGMFRVAAGAADGHDLTIVNGSRDDASFYVRAGAAPGLSAVFEFQYFTDTDAYLITVVPFKTGPGTDDGLGAHSFLSVHGNRLPEDRLPGGELRVIAHQDRNFAALWTFVEQPEGAFLVQLQHNLDAEGQEAVGQYLTIAEDVLPSGSLFRDVAVAASTVAAARVKVELP